MTDALSGIINQLERQKAAIDRALAALQGIQRLRRRLAQAGSGEEIRRRTITESFVKGATFGESLGILPNESRTTLRPQ
jgi:hypothetical protein